MLKVLFEDNHLIAVNKPPGYLVQGDNTGDEPLVDYVKKYIKERYKKPGEVFLGVIHRIDRPTSGVVIFARTSKALTRMNKLFQERKVKKTYLAITKHRPEPLEGELVHFLLKNKEKNITRAYDKLGRRTKEAKESRLHYELAASIEKSYLLKIVPETGRPHQIRAQLAAIGIPILGDLKYGYPTRNDNSCINLHSWKLEFEHPVKKEPVQITASLPNEFNWNHFKKMVREIHNGIDY